MYRSIKMTTRSGVIKTLRRRGVIWKNKSFMFGTRKMTVDEAYGVYSQDDFRRFYYNRPDPPLASRLKTLTPRRYEEMQSLAALRSRDNAHNYVENAFENCRNCRGAGCRQSLQEELIVRLSKMYTLTQFLDPSGRKLLLALLDYVNTVIKKSDKIDPFIVHNQLQLILNILQDKYNALPWSPSQLEDRSAMRDNIEVCGNHMKPIIQSAANLARCETRPNTYVARRGK